jgi:hypothetical protein
MADCADPFLLNEGEPLRNLDLRSSDDEFHLQRTVLYLALVPGLTEPLEILKS